MDTPEGLHELSYARHILEEVLGWPAKGNIEMMADCIRAISKSRNLSIVKAHAYMVRAITLAREQQIKVDRFWFQGGDYTEVRPVREVKGIPMFVPPTREELAALEEHKKSPEYLAAIAELKRASQNFTVRKVG